MTGSSETPALGGEKSRNKVLFCIPISNRRQDKAKNLCFSEEAPIIRDVGAHVISRRDLDDEIIQIILPEFNHRWKEVLYLCLLYTSDAADE